MHLFFSFFTEHFVSFYDTLCNSSFRQKTFHVVIFVNNLYSGAEHITNHDKVCLFKVSSRLVVWDFLFYFNNVSATFRKVYFSR